LNAGGNVNREERDFIDDLQIGDFGGFMFHKYGGIYNSLVQYPIDGNSPERSELNSQMHTGNIDKEADLFSYNIISDNGQLVFDQYAQKFNQLEQKNHKIEYKTDNIGRIYEWTIINEVGTKYVFGELDGETETF